MSFADTGITDFMQSKILKRSQRRKQGSYTEKPATVYQIMGQGFSSVVREYCVMIDVQISERDKQVCQGQGKTQGILDRQKVINKVANRETWKDAGLLLTQGFFQ